MKLAFSHFLAASLFSAVAKTANAISAAPDTDADALVSSILAVDGAQILEARLTGGGGGGGGGSCAGYFTGGSGVDPDNSAAVPESGVILSSGNVVDIADPNVVGSTTTDFGVPGDTDLDELIPGYSTNDACILEIDFQCPEELEGSDLTFNYVFTSEEYNEWVGSEFNDVFGWFLNGVNIAVLPDGVTPVAINNVNNGLNPAFYNDNDYDDFGGSPPFNIEADGFTTTLIAAAATQVGLNTIKLAIADAGDHVLDSWALIEAGSFTCTSNLCDEFKGCHPNNMDKRAICHRQGQPNTLCLPAPAIAAHLEQHPEDTCGCCTEEEEKRRPAFCDEYE